MSVLLKKITREIELRHTEAVSFLQEMIQIPSPSGEEAEIARYLKDKMKKLGFQDVEIDRLSNVMGVVKGIGGGRDILFNGHIDHVPVGDMKTPYSGVITDGHQFGVKGQVVYGRAASDMKAAVAAMIMAGSIIKKLDLKLKGDYKVAAVSFEELGGAGTIATIDESNFLGDLIVIGEATNMQLALGHRASTKVEVVVEGRSCHASAPERGINALYNALDLINKIRIKLIPNLPDHPLYGKATIAVTKISVKPDAFNVVPEECRFHIDCRYHPEFTREVLITRLNEIIDEIKKEDPDFMAFISEKATASSFTGYYTDPEEYPIVNEVINSLNEALGRETKVGTWRFATDGGKYYRRGLPVVGFGPSEEKFAHTHHDNVKIQDYLTAIKVYAWLACKICGVEDYSG